MGGEVSLLAQVALGTGFAGVPDAHPAPSPPVVSAPCQAQPPDPLLVDWLQHHSVDRDTTETVGPQGTAMDGVGLGLNPPLLLSHTPHVSPPGLREELAHDRGRPRGSGLPSAGWTPPPRGLEPSARPEGGSAKPPAHISSPLQLLAHGFTLHDLLTCATRDDLLYTGIRYHHPAVPPWLPRDEGVGDARPGLDRLLQDGHVAAGDLAVASQGCPCPGRGGLVCRLWAAILEHRRAVLAQKGAD